MEILHAYAGDIAKTEVTDAGLLVTGKATGPDLDIDQQICDPEWLRKAMPAWMAWGNVREQHGSIAAGVGLELEEDNAANWGLKSLCVDAGTRAKIEAKVLKGYSIGVKGARVVKDALAPGGRIVGGDIVEISYVDRPANPTATIEIAKSATTGADLQPCPAATEGPEKASDPDIEKRQFTDKERADPANHAMPGGGFPIPDAASLKDAIQAIGRAKNPAAAKAHIKARAKALGESKLIPDTWKAVWADLEKANADEWTHDPAALAAVRDGLAKLMQAELDELMKGEDEQWDLTDLLCALTMFLSWWSSESWEGEVPAPSADLNDQGDVQMTLVSLGVSADLIKAAAAETASDEDRQNLQTEVRKALGIETPAPGDTKASEADQRIKALEAELAEVKKWAAPGGPARTRTETETVKAAQVDQMAADITKFQRLADTVTDQELARGYRAKAVEVARELAGLTKTI